MVDEVPDTHARAEIFDGDALGVKLGFNEYLLGGVIVLALAAIATGVGLYLLPGDYAQLPELQPVARVARTSDFPPGASRVVNWGTRIVLVVHAAEGDLYALQGTAPTDGCILEWDEVSQRIVSPCSYLVYDLHGNVVRGLTTVPLLRYSAFAREGSVYITERLP